MPTTLDELIKKKAGLQAAQKEHFTLKVSGMEFELSPLSDDEQLELLFTADTMEDKSLYKAEEELCKRIMYTHCELMQELAKAEPPKGEPWDVFTETFSVIERAQLITQLIERARSVTELTAKNA